MIRTLIVDDDAGNRAYLRELLREHPEIEVIGEAENITDAAALIRTESPDLLFLDVEMPGGSGFDLLRQLGTWPFQVVFTTGFQHYAIQAIRFSALDYLVKPVQPDELATAIQRCRSQEPDEHSRDGIQKQFITNIAHEDEKELKLTLTQGDNFYFVAPMEVMRCNASSNYTELHLADGRRFVSARTLKEYEDMLKPWGFLRIHRSFLVNRAGVSHVEEGHVVMKNGMHIEVSRRKREEVRHALAG